MAALPPNDRPVRISAAERPRAAPWIALIAFVVLVAALALARAVLIPVTLAVILSFIVSPLVDRLRRWKLPKALAVITSVLVALAVVLTLAGVIGTQVAGLVAGLPQYQETFQNKFETLQGATIGRLGSLIGKAGTMLQSASTPAPTPAPAPAPRARGLAEQNKAQNPVPVEVHERPPSPWEIVMRFLTSALAPLETTGIVFTVSIFALLERESLRDRLIRLLGSKDLHRTTTALDEAAAKLSRYFIAQLCVNTGVGLVAGVGLALIGVPNALLWGILAGILRFVPYIGVWIAAALATALAAAVEPGWSMALWSIGLFLVTELTAGQVVEPLLYGKSTGMSPLAVIVAAIFWSWLWGPVGLILSTPLTLCLVVLGRYVEPLAFLDVLLGDGPVLTPVHAFYQRMLTGDTDSLVEHAESFLEHGRLERYADEVALPGLRLAAHDIGRGATTAEEVERIRVGVGELLDALESDPHRQREKQEPHYGSAAGPDAEAVCLCVAGPGPLDGLAARLLIEVLRRRGIPVRSVAPAEVSRTHIAALPLAGVRALCVLCLDAATVAPGLRNLSRRLHERAPDLVLVSGIWDQLGVEAQAGGGPRERHARSLAETVDCVSALYPIATPLPAPQ